MPHFICVIIAERTSRFGCLQYLDVARHLMGYGEIAFPHCTCDARKDGHVIAIAGTTSFKLQACKDDGSPEVRSCIDTTAYCEVAGSCVVMFFDVTSLLQ